MVYLKLYKTGKSGIRLLWLILLLLLIHKILPIVPHSWNFMINGINNLCILIKRGPCIYIILNFIIIFILISSSSFTHKLTNLLIKLHKKYSQNIIISSLRSHTSQKISPPLDDDSWWATIVSNEETQSFTTLHEGHETVSFELRGVEELEEVKVDDKTTSFEAHAECKVEYKTTSFEDHAECEVEYKTTSFEDHAECKVEYKTTSFEEHVVEEVKEEVEWTLDDTWKAIMEAKSKESRPQLKKSETWTSGGRGGSGRRLTYHDELKKRADAFIERVNQEMRLQRMESHQRFLDIINRGR